MIIVSSGDGEGKTSSALGIALRSLVYGRRVVFIQFLPEDRQDAESLIKKRFPKKYEIHKFSSGHKVNLKKPCKKCKAKAHEALDFVKNVLKEVPDLLVLDDILTMIKSKILSLKEVMEVLETRNSYTDIIMTGSKAPKKIVDLADVVVKLKKIKPEGRVSLKRGIHY